MQGHGRAGSSMALQPVHASVRLRISCHTGPACLSASCSGYGLCIQCCLPCCRPAGAAATPAGAVWLLHLWLTMLLMPGYCAVQGTHAACGECLT
jgi:hypothetical protein